ncbi:hypothetical protein EYR38_008206 [Pleurotus pulmonarius]|nr:hypothetical protein EYR38_008206 [Pleurotus pulmonarius]
MSRARSTSVENDAFDDEGSEVKDAEQGANDKANVEHLDHTTRIAVHSGSVILPPQSPKPAKPSACPSTTPTTPAPSSSPPPIATSIPMPGLANLILHSPSATIVGTPFALDTDIARFEYPFPDTSLSPPGLYEYHNTSSAFPLALTSSLTSPSAKSSHHHHHHAHSHPNSTSRTHSTHHTHTQHPLLADPDSAEPPVPPGLLTKTHRWSRGVRSAPQRTSTGTQRTSTGADKLAHTDDIDDGTAAAEYFDVSPGSSTSESSACSAASDALHALHISDSETLQGSDTEPSKLGEEGEVEGVEEVEGEAGDLTVRSALVG